MMHPSKIVLSSDTPGLSSIPSGAYSSVNGESVYDYIGSISLWNTVGMGANQFDRLNFSFTYPKTIPKGAVLRSLIHTMISFSSNSQGGFVGNMLTLQFPLGPGGVAPFHAVIYNIYVTQSGNNINVTATRYNTGGGGLFPISTTANAKIFGNIFIPSF